MHVNIGTGYWIYQNPNATWLTGFAPIMELHYTTTLRNANVVQLPGDGSTDVVGGTETGPQNRDRKSATSSNRVDILDMTVGSTALIGNKATASTAFIFPAQPGRQPVFNWNSNSS